MTTRAWAAVLGALALAGTGFAGIGLAIGSSSLLAPAAAASASPASTTPAGTATGCATTASTVTVQGYGSAEGQPDVLTISLGVQTQAASAAAALNSNSTKANALISKLEADGVTKQDLQTSGLSIQPVYTGPKQLITAYQVVNTVTVTLHDLGAAGKVIDDAAQAAGNAIVVNNIAFSVQDDSALLGEARAAAVRQALGQAQLMASAAGMSLGHVCSLVDNTSPPQPQNFDSNVPAKAATSTTPVEPGQEQVTADVTAVYELLTNPAAS